MTLLACAVLSARLATPQTQANASPPDTARIQAALNLCSPGRAVVLARDGRRAAFESAPLILPRGVTLFIDRGVTLFASRNPRDYDLAPEHFKPFLFAYQAAFSGVGGGGAIDGQGTAPELVSSYESQGFEISGVTLRNAAGVHAAIYKTIALKVSGIRIESPAGSTASGLLLSNAQDAAVTGVWIRVSGEAVALKASILGPTSQVAIRDAHIFGGRGIRIGDDTFGSVNGVKLEDLFIDGKCLRGMAEPSAPPGRILEGKNLVTACDSPPFSSAPPSAPTAPALAARRTPARAQIVSPGRSIQAAVDALPNTGGEVRLEPGTYREVVTIRKPHVHLYGDDPDPARTVIVFGNGPGQGGTFASATVFVEAPDVTIDRLTIANDLGVGKGQGVALAVTADRAVFRRLRLLGAQDTLFAASRYCYGDYGPCVAARQYFEDCYIEGNTDFIFGDSQAVFERCQLHAIASGGVMYTAQSRHTAEQRDSGYVFDHCRLTGDPRQAGISLGRPWRPYATVVFLNAQIDAPVIPAGWTEWLRFGKPSLPTAYYAEYQSTGPGANPQARDAHSHQLTAAEAEQWSPGRFLVGADAWNPR